MPNRPHFCPMHVSADSSFWDNTFSHNTSSDDILSGHNVRDNPVWRRCHCRDDSIFDRYKPPPPAYDEAFIFWVQVCCECQDYQIWKIMRCLEADEEIGPGDCAARAWWQIRQLWKAIGKWRSDWEFLPHNRLTLQQFLLDVEDAIVNGKADEVYQSDTSVSDSSMLSRYTADKDSGEHDDDGMVADSEDYNEDDYDDDANHKPAFQPRSQMSHEHRGAKRTWADSDEVLGREQEYGSRPQLRARKSRRRYNDEYASRNLHASMQRLELQDSISPK